MKDHKQHKAEEIITGALIGIGIGILMFHRVIFGADLTEADQELLAQAVEAESGNQSLQGRRYVASVILNRQDSEVFPDTIEDILSQPRQFSTYPALMETEASWQSRLAVKMEIEARSDNDIVFFRAGRYGCGKAKFQYEDHYFSTLADDEK